MSDKNPASSTAKCTYPIKKRPAMIVNLQSKLDLKDQTQEAAAALASLSDTCDKASSAASSTKTDPEDYHSDSEESYSSLNGVFPKVVHNPSKNKMMVDHTYTDYGVIKEDYLRFLEDGDEDLSSLSDEEKLKMQKRAQKIRNIFGDVGPSRKNSGGVVKPFPEKLMDVLEREDMESIITWMPHGRAFIVLQPQQLRDIVLPRFFKQTKFMSFTRQLNLWGFKRITKGVDSGAYYHALFLRGRPRLAMLMKRQKIKGTGIKLSPNPETEPNFYEISEKSVLPPIDPSKKEKKPLPPLRQHLPSRAILDNSASMLEYEGMNRSARSANRLQTGFDRQIYPFGSSVQNGADPLSLIPGSGLNNVSGICDNFSMPLLPQQQPASSGSNDFINILQQKVFLEQQQQQQQHQMRRYGQAVSSEQLFNNPYDSLAPSRANEDLQLQELKQRLLNAARTMEPQPQQMSQRYLLQKLQQQHSSNYHSPYFPSELGLRQQHQFQQATSTGDEVAALMSTLENTRNVALATQARLEQVTRDLQHARNRRSL